ncbi:GspH/FimT family pseudopilin [Stenotrophomonas sp. YIM B06876]|uniref:type II secretion system protein XpsH n=1 Tax=Stenotrophomonas sp. YIM B06876 TaxID=3060211 RepID=UPI002739B2C7|nr:GspH/FimT family pseudopilin [Stenotrophomonas sp. YIM B06876]
MMLVMALIALTGLLTAMAMGGGMEGMRLRSQARQLAAQLRYTRTQAIATGVPQRFTVDPRTHRWQGANGRHGELPASLAVSFTGAREVQPQAGVGAIGFFEDGASTGGRIDLRAGAGEWRIEVGWITGQVKAGRVHGRTRQ